MKKYTFLARLTDDGMIDMFIMGLDSIPVARIKEPTRTGEEAEIAARAWVAAQEEAEALEKAKVDEDKTLAPGIPTQ